MAQLFANNAFGSLGATLSAVATSLTLGTGQGARFPTPTGGDHFLLTLVGLDGSGNENAWEIVKITARSTDTLTVVRAQEGTTAALWAAGTRVELRATAGTLDGLLQKVGGTVTGPVTVTSGAYTAFKVGLTGLVSIGGEAGSAEAKFTVTDAGNVGLEVSPTAIAGAVRLLSYNRAGSAFAPMTLMASEHKMNVSGSDIWTVSAGGVSYTGTLTGGTGVVNLGSGQFYKAADGKVGFGTTTPYATVDAIDTMRINASANGNDAVFTLRSGSTAGTTQQILFSKAGSAGDVRIIGDNENNALRIVTAGGTVGTFDSAGNLLVGPTSNTLSKVNAYATGGGGPASTPSNASMTLGASSTSGVLSAGVDASSGFYSWIQSRSGSAGETYYDLAIQPRGGNLLVGTSTSEGGKFQIRCSTGDYVRISDGSYGALIGSAITLTGSGATADVAFRVVNELVFARSGGAISGKFDSSGNLLVGTTSALGRVASKSGSGFTSNSFRSDSDTAGDTTWTHFYGTSSGATVANIAIFGNGNVQNLNNSYGAISDLKLKDNITDASPKLAKLMQVRIVNYTLKSDPDKTKLIGVIAQELEQISPGLIEETPDYEEVTKTREVEVPAVEAVLDDEGNEVTPAVPASTKTEEYTERVPLGTVTKSVKYSVFVPMLIKGMQEQQAHIEAMQAQLDAQNEAMQLLAARLAALEAK